MKSRHQIIQEQWYYEYLRRQREAALRHHTGVPSRNSSFVSEFAEAYNDALLNGWKSIGKAAKKLFFG